MYRLRKFRFRKNFVFWFLLRMLGVSSMSYHETKAHNYTNLISVVKTVHSLANGPITTLFNGNPDYELDYRLVISIQNAIGTIKISDKEPSKLTVIVFNDNQDVYLMNDKDFWDPAYYYILYFPKFSDPSYSLFKYLWGSFRVYRVILIYNSHNYLYVPDLITKSQKAFHISDLYAFQIVSTKAPNLSKKPFYSVFAGKFNMAAAHHRKDMVLLDVICSKLNMTLEILNTTDGLKYGYKTSNGTYVGVFKDLVERRGNISFNLHFLIPDELDVQRDISFSHFVRASKVCFGVSKSREIPPFIAALRAFNFKASLCVVFSFGIAGIALRCLRKVSAKFRLEKSAKFNSVMTVYGLCLGIPVTFQPRKAYERFIISSILLMSFVGVISIQSTFTTILSTPPTTYEVPQTKEEINNMKFPVWTSSLDLINTLKEEGYNKVRFHLRTKHEQETEFWSTGDIGMLEKVPASLDVNFWEYKDYNFQMTGVCNIPNYESLVFPRGSPYLHHINQIIIYLQAGGIIEKWFQDYYEAEFRTRRPHKANAEIKAISMKHLEIPFLLMVVSLGISLIVLLLEISIHRIKFRKPRQLIK